MEFIGKVIDALAIKKGVSAKGNEWKIFEFVLETAEQYPKKAIFKLWNDDIEKFGKLCNPKLGLTLKVSYDIDASKSKNGIWFNELKAWKIEEFKGVQPSSESSSEQQSTASGDNNVQSTGNSGGSDAVESDDLPF